LWLLVWFLLFLFLYWKQKLTVTLLFQKLPHSQFPSVANNSVYEAQTHTVRSNCRSVHRRPTLLQEINLQVYLNSLLHVVQTLVLFLALPRTICGINEIIMHAK
jgi:hypothetical protein